jgi:hypothetical protein
MRHRLVLVASVLAIVLTGIPAAAWGRGEPGQAPPPASEPAAARAPTSPPAAATTDLDRIRRALSQAPALDFDAQQLRFYIEIIARKQRFSEYVKGYDFLNGPTKRGNPMTHQEFLNMVTPKEMYSSAGITATDMLQFAVTNWLGHALINKAIEDLQNAKTDREAQEIRDRITRELQALSSSGGH